jgi:hypothetical protein
MRIVKHIPHDRLLIQIHQYNGKYILSIELGDFVQSFKVVDSEIPDLDLLEKQITPEFLSSCVKRFVEMRTDWINLQQKLS